MKNQGIKEKAKGLLKNKKSMEIIIAVIIIAIIVMIYISTLMPSKPQTNELQDESSNQSVVQLETRLEDVLSAIDGAGSVRVMITYETDKEIVPAMDTQRQSTTNENMESGALSQSETESKKPVTVQQQSGAETVIITEKQPVVRGVVIVAQGAGNPKVKMDLLQAAQTVLNISPAQVDVFTMNKKD